MKKLVSFLVLLATVCTLGALLSCKNPQQMDGYSKYTPSEGLKFQLDESGEGYYLADLGDFSGTELVIPKTYEGKPVIGVHFWDNPHASTTAPNTTVTKIVVPETVLYISHQGFSNYQSLTEVEFYGVPILTGFSFPTTLCHTFAEDGGVYLGNLDNPYFFFIGLPQEVGEIEEYTLHKDTKSISIQAFAYTTPKKINLPDGLLRIAPEAFLACEQLESIDIPKSVITIGDGVRPPSFFNPTAFMHCNSLSSITVDKDNKFYSSVDGVLYDKTQKRLMVYPAKKQDESFVIPSSVEEIEAYAFLGAPLKSLTVGSNIKSIGNSAFYNCYDLTDLDFSAQVEVLEYDLFRGCAFTEFAVPQSVTKIYSAFETNSDLTITFGNHVSILNSPFGSNHFSDRTKAINYLGSLEDWCNREYTNHIAPYELYISGVKLTDLVVPETVTELRAGAFAGCISLKTVDIHSEMATIGNRCFANCTNLEKITLPFTGNPQQPLPGVTPYPFDYIFGGIVGEDLSYGVPPSLKTVVYTGETLHSRSFVYCNSIELVIIADSVKTIGDRVFTSCKGLTDVVIGSGVTSIGKAIFPLSSVQRVYYKGSEADWNNITFANITPFSDEVTLYFYSEEAPTASGNYWHYDENGEIAVW